MFTSKFQEDCMNFLSVSLLSCYFFILNFPNRSKVLPEKYGSSGWSLKNNTAEESLNNNNCER